MTRENAKNILPIIQAFTEGEKIECRCKCSNLWETIEYPAFNFLDFEYRIKSQPKLVPFTFKDRDMFKDKWVKSKIKDSNVIKRFINISENYICIYNNGLFSLFTYETLLNDFEFEDGSPCGKYVNE